MQTEGETGINTTRHSSQTKQEQHTDVNSRRSSEASFIPSYCEEEHFRHGWNLNSTSSTYPRHLEVRIPVAEMLVDTTKARRD